MVYAIIGLICSIYMDYMISGTCYYSVQQGIPYHSGMSGMRGTGRGGEGGETSAG